MKTKVGVSILVWVVLCLGVGLGKAQTTNPNNKSLGDLAREFAAQKSKAPKPVKVITNDNIAKANSETATTPSPADKKPADVTAPANPDEKKGEVHNEKYYRSKMSELQSNLDMHKRELEVLQQKLGINQTQYYNDPNKTLQQEYTRGDINKLNEDIDAKNKQIADDEKAIEDLNQQLRREGGDPGWLR